MKVQGTRICFYFHQVKNFASSGIPIKLAPVLNSTELYWLFSSFHFCWLHFSFCLSSEEGRVEGVKKQDRPWVCVEGPRSLNYSWPAWKSRHTIWFNLFLKPAMLFFPSFLVNSLFLPPPLFWRQKSSKFLMNYKCIVSSVLRFTGSSMSCAQKVIFAFLHFPFSSNLVVWWIF